MVKDLCFEIIETCLNNCMFCSSNSNCDKKQMISYEDFKRVIDYFMKDGKIEELSISGGEPFLHPDLIKMVAYAKSLNIRTIIFTSGVVYSDKITLETQKNYLGELKKAIDEITLKEPDNLFLIEKVTNYYNNLAYPKNISGISKEKIRILKELALDKIVFDFQAYESEIDYKIMGRKELSRQAFFDSIIRSSLLGLDIDIHFIPNKINYKEIKDVLEFLQIADVKNISLLNFVPQGSGRINQNQLLLSDEEKCEFFDILEEVKKFYSGNIRIGIPLKDEMHRCNAGLEKIDIKFDGTILPCPAFKELTTMQCKKFNISLPNIYTNLEDVKIPGKGKRAKQLCKQVYGKIN